MTTENSTLGSQKTMTLSLVAIGECLAPLRICDPAAEQNILQSMQKYGQLTPVIVYQSAPGASELVDGFKRLRAGRQLGFKELTARSLVGPLRAGKVAMLQLNHVGRSIRGMEEALVVHSLCHEDGLTQTEIALLLGRHKSWVCRRLALIERLSDEAQQSIRLGLLPASLGAELARLQRCNQQGLLAAIGTHHLTWRETRQVVAALLNTPTQAHEAILRNPREAVLEPEESAILSPAEERGLGFETKQLLRQVATLEKHCLAVACLLSSTELGQFQTHEEQRVRADCARALASLGLVQGRLREMTDAGTAPDAGGSVPQ